MKLWIYLSRTDRAMLSDLENLALLYEYQDKKRAAS